MFGKAMPCFMALCLAVPAYGQPEEVVVEAGELTLGQAIARAVAQNPRLEAQTYALLAADGRIEQAGLRPNPEIELEVENLRLDGGSDTTTRSRSFGIDATGGNLAFEPGIGRTKESGADGLEEYEVTLTLSQRFELGGKRAKRTDVAEAEKAVLQRAYEVAEANLVADVHRAFVAVLGAQEGVALAERQLELATAIFDTASARAEAGKVAPLETRRARVDLEAAEAALEQAHHVLSARRRALATLWGEPTAEFERVAGALGAPRPLPDFGILHERVVRTPDLAQWAAELEQREAAVALAKAQGVPDLTLALGLRAEGIADTDAQGWEAGLGSAAYSWSDTSASDTAWGLVFRGSIPLPIFDRNQGTIKAAEQLVGEAAALKRATDVELTGMLATRYEETAGNLSKWQALEERILPEAVHTNELIREGYREGKFDLLDVLLSERGLIDYQSQQLEALELYHLGIADLERYTAGHVFEDNPLAEAGQE